MPASRPVEPSARRARGSPPFRAARAGDPDSRQFREEMEWLTR